MTSEALDALVRNSGDKYYETIFTATCFSNVEVMGSLDVRPSVRP